MKIDNLEKKRQSYREWLKKNPPIFDENTGYEMKECEGCYCQMLADCPYDFCFDCLDCDQIGCGENFKPNVGNCCACFGQKKGNPAWKRKPLTFTQKQRLHFEQIKRQMDDLIAEIKGYEDTDDLLTAKRIEDVKRWAKQAQQRTFKSLSLETKKQ